MEGSGKKTDNKAAAMAAKVELRQNVKTALGDCHVLEAFCGLGHIHAAVWTDVASYTGIDVRWSMADRRRRFVGDNRRVLRAIDLPPFNVFDLDSYGSPWEQAVIIASRRTWAKGERGAIVVTDGDVGMLARRTVMPTALAELMGSGSRMAAPTASSGQLIHRSALSAWTRRAGVSVVKQWMADAPAGKGGLRMIYSAAVFEGVG
jgi:hypothetical protein